MLTAHVLSVLRRHLSHYCAAKKMTIAIVMLDRLNVVLTLCQVLHNNNAEVSIGDFCSSSSGEIKVNKVAHLGLESTCQNITCMTWKRLQQESEWLQTPQAACSKVTTHAVHIFSNIMVCNNTEDEEHSTRLQHHWGGTNVEKSKYCQCWWGAGSCPSLAWSHKGNQ